MNNPSVFPNLHPSSECRYNESGMTLRDYFAAAAIPTVKAFTNTSSEYDAIAQCAYAMADAMMKARES